jgi:cysteine-rich repeat protein
LQKRFDFTWPLLAVALAAACSDAGLATADAAVGGAGDAGWSGADPGAFGGAGAAPSGGTAGYSRGIGATGDGFGGRGRGEGGRGGTAGARGGAGGTIGGLGASGGVGGEAAGGRAGTTGVGGTAGSGTTDGFAGNGGGAGGSVDGGGLCGNGVPELDEECDLGAGNVDRPAFLVTQGRSTSVVPVDRVVSASMFYGLASASSHTGLEAVATSRVYLYRDTTTGILSLVVHHGVDRNTSGQAQPAGHVVFDLASVPVSTVVAVTDDAPSEFFKGSPDSAHGEWDFQNNSDGGVLSGFPMPASWSITIAAQFQRGIGSWQYVDGSLRTLDLAVSAAVTITAFDSPSACRSNCTVPRCGDGILDGGEVCDDGNVASGDGCSAECKALR